MKKVISSFIVYSLPDIISQLVPFFVLPVTTAYLTLIDFGNISLFYLCSIPFIILTECGLGYVINSLWYRYDKKGQGELLFNSFLVKTVLTVFAVIVVTLISGIIFIIIIGKEWVVIRTLYWLLVLNICADIPSSVFRYWVVVERKAAISSATQIIKILLEAGSIVGAAIITRDFRWVLAARVTVTVCISIVHLYYISRVFQPKISKDILISIYRIGAPAFWRSFFNIMRKRIDKIFIANLFGSAQLAMYTFSEHLLTFYHMAGDNYIKSFQPDIYSQLSKGKLDLKNLRRVLLLFFYIVFVGCLVFISIGDRLITIFTHGMFTQAYPVMLLFSCYVLLAVVFLAHSDILVFYQKTKYLLGCTVVQAITTVLLSIALIPKFGGLGAVSALWCGLLINNLLYFVKKQQLLPEHFIEKTVLLYVLAYHLMVILRVWFQINPGLPAVALLFFIVTIHGSLKERDYISDVILKAWKTFSVFGKSHIAKKVA